MATKTWLGKAQAQKQVNTVTVGGAAGAGDTYSVTINSKAITYTADGTETNDDVAAALQALLAAATDPEFREVVWTADAAVITGTAATAGVPFTQTSGATGTGTLTTATATANISPNDIGNATNWSGGTLPIDGDDVVLEKSDVSLLYNPTALSSINLASFTRRSSFTGRVGNDIYNPAGYYEYRGTTLVLAECTVLTVEQAASDAAGQIKLNVGTAGPCTATVTGQAFGATVGGEAVWLTGGDNASSLLVVGASVALARLAGDAAEFPTLKLAGGALVACGAGATLGTIDNDASTLYTLATYTTLSQSGQATTLVEGAAAATTQNVEGGTLDWRSSGGYGTIKASAGTTIDFSANPGAVTGTAAYVNATTAWLDPNGRHARPYTVEIDGRADLNTVAIATGGNIKVTIANHT